MQASDALKEMKSFREKLPAFKMKSEFLKAVSKNQVGRAIYHDKNVVFIIGYWLDADRFVRNIIYRSSRNK